MFDLGSEVGLVGRGRGSEMTRWLWTTFASRLKEIRRPCYLVLSCLALLCYSCGIEKNREVERVQFVNGCCGCTCAIALPPPRTPGNLSLHRPSSFATSS